MRGSVCGFLLLLVSQIKAAPKLINEDRLYISNPFGFEANEVRFLKDYLKSNKKVQDDLENMTREQALLYLFAFYDYNKSGYLDGLDLLQLLHDFWSQQPQSQPFEQLVQHVDEVLEKQDLNGDGLLNPSELLTPPVEIHVSRTAGEVKEEEVNGLPPEPQKETTSINEGLQGHEEPQVVGVESVNHQGSDILEKSEVNANNPAMGAIEYISVDNFEEGEFMVNVEEAM
uniref:Cell growth regulator with EF hand domain protein 1 n=1 Tax=Geotrypetes seraphini TaxID=260995 RepID=A0A6P8QVE1_GEOSA|nr:cell growth regulator with EF hand domain protein 1 [Geotrypetes seraphini]